MKTVPMGRVARKGGEDSDGAAFSLLAGGGVAGEVLPDTRFITQGAIGLGIDMRPITIQFRARYGQSNGGRTTVVKSDIIGGDLSALMGFDVGRFYLGAGPRVGGDLFMQSFPDQDLESRRAASGRLSLFGVVNFSITPRISLFLEPSLDAYLLPVSDAFGGAEEQTVRLSPSGIGGLQIYL